MSDQDRKSPLQPPGLSLPALVQSDTPLAGTPSGTQPEHNFGENETARNRHSTVARSAHPACTPAAPLRTMNPGSQPFFPGARSALAPEEHEVSVLGAPQGAMPAKTTTVVNVHSDAVVPDHVVWSLFNTLFFNPCCLGFVAFAFSVKSRDRKMVGDVIGAQSYASTAKCLNIWAVVLGLLMTVGLIVLLVILLPGAVRAAQENYGGGF